jgi:hypothetical protein
VDDPSPDERRTAVDLCAADPGAPTLLSGRIEKETVPAIAAAAAAVLCARLPRAQATAWTRLRELTLDKSADPADAIELLGCLASGSTDDRAVVSEAAKHHPSALVRAAAVDFERVALGPPPPGLRPAPATDAQPARVR